MRNLALLTLLTLLIFIGAACQSAPEEMNESEEVSASQFAETNDSELEPQFNEATSEEPDLPLSEADRHADRLARLIAEAKTKTPKDPESKGFTLD